MFIRMDIRDGAIIGRKIESFHIFSDAILIIFEKEGGYILVDKTADTVFYMSLNQSNSRSRVQTLNSWEIDGKKVTQLSRTYDDYNYYVFVFMALMETNNMLDVRNIRQRLPKINDNQRRGYVD